MASSERFSIAHVTPYPWEAQENEVNTYVVRVAERALAARAPRADPRAVALAGACRASRRALRPRAGGGRRSSCWRGPTRASPRDRRRRGARCPRLAELRATPRRRTPALPIDVARTVEELLSTVPLDFVHVHEPFAPSTSNAALRHSRSLNVGSFHCAYRAPALDAGGAAFRGELLRAPGRPHREPARDGGADGPPFPGRVPPRARRRRRGRGARGDLPRPGGAPARPRRGCGAAPAPGQRPLIDVDLHMHTDHSHDCATPVEVLLATARAQGLGRDRGDRPQRDLRRAGGARAGRGQDRTAVKVIVGEEVKTAARGGGDRPVHRGEDPARAEPRRRRSPRSAARAGSCTCRTRSTGCTRCPTTSTC